MEPEQRLHKNSSTSPDRVPFMTKFIATGCFSGYIPWASGTFGSCVGLLVYLVPGVEQTGILLFLIASGFMAGVVTSAKVAAAVGNELSRSATRAKEMFQGAPHDVPDPSIVVIDEIVGMWIAVFLLPKTLWIILLAFIFFRLYDIVKPPPARQLERIPDGWGIMLDDVAAGIYANLTVRLVELVFPHIA